MRISWPSLSLRATLLAAMLIGVVAPAALMMLVDPLLTRQLHAPSADAARSAELSLLTVGVEEALAVRDVAAVGRVVRRALEHPNIGAVEVRPLGFDAGAVRMERQGAHLAAAPSRATVYHQGRVIGEVALWPDDDALGRLLAERRDTLVKLLLVQVGLTMLVLSPVLYARVVLPIERLKRQASAMAWRLQSPPLQWRRRDELGQLGRHLNEVRARIDSLFAKAEAQKAQLESLAMFDHLTGLPNRSLLAELARRDIQNAQRSGQRLALLQIDVDHFKTVNDSLGHAAGDEMIRTLAQRLRAALRDVDVLARPGGDEFMVLLREPGSWDEVAASAERLLKAVEQPLQVAGQPLQVSASIGVALHPDDGSDYETLAREADIAMYQAKALGRARYSFFHAELNNRLQANLALAQELAGAIQRGELELHYQPQVDARSGELVGLEALVRWRHPQRGVLQPEAFITIAEESGLIADLGAWVIDSACRQIARWKREGRSFGHVAVNISAHEFRGHRLVETFERAMQEHGVAPQELEVELTESVLMSDTRNTQNILLRLRALGLSLVIDDFGTGYSSLAYLKQLRPSKLKIDRAFVRDLHQGRDERALTAAVIGLTRALEVVVVAEGVETEAQRSCLVEDGCQVLQGYLMARPLTAADLELGWLGRTAANESSASVVAVG